MLILDTTSDKVQLVTSAAGSIDVSASFVDYDKTSVPYTVTPGSTPTAITTATTTDIVAAPASSTIFRNVKGINSRNKHATTSNTVTVQHVTGAGTFELFKCSVLAGEELVLNDLGTWFVYDKFGGVKSGPSMIIDPTINDFRLSGVSATPVMTADSTTLSTIFLCQYKGGDIALFDGINWQLATPASEVSIAVTGRTTDLPVDVYAFLSAGVVTLELLNWTNATTRATGLTRVDGVWTKTGDSTRRYLGSFRPRSATTFHFVRNGDDLPCKLDLWNVDNRVNHGFTLRALTDSWNYTTATWRQAQASANYQIDIMVGLQEEYFVADLVVTSRNSTASILRAVAIGFDSTTTPSGTYAETTNEVISINCDQNARIVNQPAIGRHLYAWLEISAATGTCTWCGDDGTTNPSRHQSGISGAWMC